MTIYKNRNVIASNKAIIMLIVFLFIFNVNGLTVNAEGRLIPITGAVLNDQLNFKLDSASVVPVGDDGTPVLPISYNGTTYLPVRAIGYLLSLGIDYEATTKTVLIASTTTKPAPVAQSTTKSNKLMPISNAVLNEQLKFKLDGISVVPVGDDGTPVLPISYNGTTYLPVRAIGYLLNLGVDWDNNTRTVLLSRSGSAPTNNNESGKKWVLVDVKTNDWQKSLDDMNAISSSYRTYAYDDNTYTGTHTITATNTFTVDTGIWAKKGMSQGGTFSWTELPTSIMPGNEIKLTITAMEDYKDHGNMSSIGSIVGQIVYIDADNNITSSYAYLLNNKGSGVFSATSEGQGGEVLGVIQKGVEVNHSRMGIHIQTTINNAPLKMLYIYEYK